MAQGSFTERWYAFFTQPIQNILIRLACLILGFAFIALGVAISRSTGLGTSPISAVPNVLSYLTSITIGQWTMIVNMLFVVVQIVLLRKQFQPIQLLQVPATALFSWFIDFFVPYAEMVPQPNYFSHVLVLCVAMVVTALGVFLEVRAALIPLPGEGVSVTVSKVFSIPFHKCKVGFDMTCVVTGVIISIAVIHGLVGVREGTIFVAIFTGYVVHFIERLFPHFDRFVPVEGMLDISKRASKSQLK